MIDKNDPEIQAYLKEELQKQKEQITERILWRNAKSLLGGPTYADMEYYTGLSRAEIEEIGYGFGTKEFAQLSCVRAFLGYQS